MNESNGLEFILVIPVVARQWSDLLLHSMSKFNFFNKKGSKEGAYRIRSA